MGASMVTDPAILALGVSGVGVTALALWQLKPKRGKRRPPRAPDGTPIPEQAELASMAARWTEEQNGSGTKKPETIVHIKDLIAHWRDIGGYLDPNYTLNTRSDKVEEFYRDFILQAYWFSGKKFIYHRAVVIQILELLSKYREAPSVVLRPAYPSDTDAKWDESFETLAKVSLIEHTLNATELAIAHLVKKRETFRIPDAIVATMAHDIGKLPDLNNLSRDNFVAAEHPIMSGEVLSSFQYFNDIPQRDAIVKAVIAHHNPVEDPESLNAVVQIADRAARQAEFVARGASDCIPHWIANVESPDVSILFGNRAAEIYQEEKSKQELDLAAGGSSIPKSVLELSKEAQRKAWSGEGKNLNPLANHGQGVMGNLDNIVAMAAEQEAQARNRKQKNLFEEVMEEYYPGQFSGPSLAELIPKAKEWVDTLPESVEVDAELIEGHLEISADRALEVFHRLIDAGVLSVVDQVADEQDPSPSITVQETAGEGWLPEEDEAEYEEDNEPANEDIDSSSPPKHEAAPRSSAGFVGFNLFDDEEDTPPAGSKGKGKPRGEQDLEPPDKNTLPRQSGSRNPFSEPTEATTVVEDTSYDVIKDWFRPDEFLAALAQRIDRSLRWSSSEPTTRKLVEVTDNNSSGVFFAGITYKNFTWVNIIALRQTAAEQLRKHSKQGAAALFEKSTAGGDTGFQDQVLLAIVRYFQRRDLVDKAMLAPNGNYYSISCEVYQDTAAKRPGKRRMVPFKSSAFYANWEQVKELHAKSPLVKRVSKIVPLVETPKLPELGE